MREKGKEVAVTASTGMAAIPLGGTTVHHWAGLADNRYTKEKTLGALDDTTRARINKADVLVLDEIGMISATVFSKLEYVIRHVRTSELIFGGIQVNELSKSISILNTFCTLGCTNHREERVLSFFLHT